jgi:hypothetical protein
MPGIVNPKLEVVTSGGTLVNEVLYPNPVTVHWIHVAHSGGSAAWIQIHDSATVPAEGTVPQQVHAVAANSDAVIELFNPLHFHSGVYICESTTLPTKTLQASEDLFIFMGIEVPPHSDHD